MGHGGAGERSVGGGSPWMERVENSLRRDWRVGGRAAAAAAPPAAEEWWAGLGTVTAALEGLMLEGVALRGREVAGKCLFL